MLKLEDFSAWLKIAPRNITAPIRLKTMPETPDVVAVLSATGGYSLEVEDSIDVPTFQVRARGLTAIQARDLAYQLDAAIIDAVPPFLLGVGGNQKRVIDRGRVGGPPADDETDERGRSEVVCNYWLRIER